MSKNVYLNILKAGIFFSLISVFLVFTDLLFPYISSKQIYFNILIEILAVFWLAFIVKFEEYRPKKSYISYGLAAYFFVILISCFTGVDFNLSFWGDVERMLGFFHIFHFFIFYLILITVFRDWRDWRVIMIASVLFANLVALNGISGDPMSTIGNPAYVAGYLIFNIYFAMILFFREKNKILRWLYIIALPLMIMAFFRADSSGAQVGLGFSVLVFFFLYGLFSKNKKLKTATLSIGAIGLILVVLFLANKDTNFVKNNSFLHRFTEISLQKNTFQTRLISWRAAIKDFKNHPILGTGHGNYAIIFDKYFDSIFYTYTPSETYFDRAHNNLIDIASTTGALGLLAYLSIFVAAAYYLFVGFRWGKINLLEFCLVSCLIIAYFVQNLAVFDSMVTYMGIMITLAFINWLHEEGEENLIDKAVEAGDKLKQGRKADNMEVYALVLGGFISLVIMYNYNIKPIQMLAGTIKGHAEYQQGLTEKSYEDFKTALSLNTVLNRDAASVFIRLMAGDMSKLEAMDHDKAQEILDYAIEQAKKNVAYNPKDSMNQLILSQILDAAARFNKDNQDKFFYYYNQALAASDASIESSPGRATNYFFKAQLLSTSGDKDGAIKALKYAVSLNENFSQSNCYLAKFLVYYDRAEEAYSYMDKCIDLGGLGSITSDLLRRVANHYIEAGDLVRTEKIIIALTQLEKGNLENWINLIKLYGQMGEKEKARAAADKAIEIDYSVKSYADQYVNSIQ